MQGNWSGNAGLACHLDCRVCLEDDPNFEARPLEPLNRRRNRDAFGSSKVGFVPGFLITHLNVCHAGCCSGRRRQLADGRASLCHHLKDLYGESAGQSWAMCLQYLRDAAMSRFGKRLSTVTGSRCRHELLSAQCAVIISAGVDMTVRFH